MNQATLPNVTTKPTRPTPRPGSHDPAVLAAAARELAKTLAERFPEFRGIEERTAKQLEDEIWLEDGYEIARNLDRAGWAVDEQLVDALSMASICIQDAHEEAVAAWVKAMQIEPLFEIGARVVFTDRSGRSAKGKTIHGEVYEINREQAEYSVFCKSLGHVRGDVGTQGVILSFEDVKADR